MANPVDRIANLSDGHRLNQTITLRGWVRTRRSGGKEFLFLNINDGSNQSGIQIVCDTKLENYEAVRKLTTGSSVEVRGLLVPSMGKGQAFEVQANQVTVYGVADGEEYPLQKKGHTLEFLREIAHLRPRSNTFGAVFRIRNTLSFAVHRFFQERGFFYINTPIITASDAEGSGELFQVTGLDLEDPPRSEQGEILYENDFFHQKTHLTVSGQLEGETFATAMSLIYTFGPTFRAENSNTSRHLAEFWMVEPEMAFYSLEDAMDLAEEFLKFLIQECLTHNLKDLEFLQNLYKKKILPTFHEPNFIDTLEHVLHSHFEHVSYTDAITILTQAEQHFEFPVQWGMDLQSEHERYLTEKHFKRPVIVRDYPKDIKAFYMKQNPDERTVAAMDVLVPNIGEVIGGSQREEDYQRLKSRIEALGLDIEEYWWYLDLRKFGTVPHAGFGLGLERMTQYVTGMANIRDVIPFPRVPGNARF